MELILKPHETEMDGIILEIIVFVVCHFFCNSNLLIRHKIFDHLIKAYFLSTIVCF